MPQTIKNKGVLGKSRKHGPSRAAKSKSRGHGKGKRTMKGGWFNPKKLNELTVDKLLKNYGRPKTFGIYREENQKQKVMDLEVLNNFLNKNPTKKQELCNGLKTNSGAPNANNINSALACESDYAKPKAPQNPSNRRLPSLPMPTTPAPLPPITNISAPSHANENIYGNAENFNDTDGYLKQEKVLSIIRGINDLKSTDTLNGRYAVIVNITDNHRILIILQINGADYMSFISGHYLYKCNTDKSMQPEIKNKLNANVDCNTNTGGQYYFYINNRGNTIMCIKPRCTKIGNTIMNQPALCYDTSSNNPKFPFPKYKLFGTTIMIKLPNWNNGELNNFDICDNKPMNITDKKLINKNLGNDEGEYEEIPPFHHKNDENYYHAPHKPRKTNPYAEPPQSYHNSPHYHKPH